MSFLIEAFKKECVHFVIEFPVGVYGNVKVLIKPSYFANKSNCLLVNSLLWSLRMYLLPLNVEYKLVKICFDDLIGTI